MIGKGAVIKSWKEVPPAGKHVWVNHVKGEEMVQVLVEVKENRKGYVTVALASGAVLQIVNPRSLMKAVGDL